MNRVVISQPMLFPWPGFFEQLMMADTYLFLDDVQFSKGSFTNRVKIKNAGTVKWLTAALSDSGSFKNINQLQAASAEWRKNHLQMINQSYRGAPYLRDVMAIVDAVYAQETLCDVLIASIVEPAKYLNIGATQQRTKTSALGVAGHSSERVLNLVKHFNGTHYLTGHGAAQYLDHENFESAGVVVEYMAYSKTPWPQQGTEFTPFLSILDLIANTGRYATDHLRPATLHWRDHLKGQQTP